MASNKPTSIQTTPKHTASKFPPKQISRSKTGIGELDSLIGGGIPCGSKLLLLGGPGTGKTIFGLQYLWNGATKFNERGIYLSFEMRLSQLDQTSSNFGWDFSKIEDKAHFCRYSLEGQLHADALTDMVEKVKAFKPDRIVFDSLTAYIDFTLPRMMKSQEFANAGSEVAARYKIHDLIDKLTEAAPNATMILIDEERSSGYHVSGFIADGILELAYMSIGEIQTRTALIKKMRYTSHAEETLPLTIEAGEGILIQSPVTVYDLHRKL